MKIQLLSDIHLEFGDYTPQISPEADVIVFAGDIDIKCRGLEWMQSHCSGKFGLYVLGNHDLWKGTYPSTIEKAKAQNTDRFFTLENNAVEIEGVTFHGCTLWTDYNLYGTPKETGSACQSLMNDHKKIRRLPSYSKLPAMDMNSIHIQSREWLRQSLLNSKTENNVVITHHAPSKESIPERYLNDVVSAAYASDMEDFILETMPNVWLHGHVHDSFDYDLYGCRVVCNPKGYTLQPNPDFGYVKIVEI